MKSIARSLRGSWADVTGGPARVWAARPSRLSARGVKSRRPVVNQGGIFSSFLFPLLLGSFLFSPLLGSFLFSLCWALSFFPLVGLFPFFPLVGLFPLPLCWSLSSSPFVCLFPRRSYSPPPSVSLFVPRADTLKDVAWWGVTSGRSNAAAALT